jgi:hypothetical protein
MTTNQHGNEIDPLKEPRVFRPSRWKFWLPVLGGVWLVSIGTLFLLIPILIAADQRGWAMLVVGLSGLCMLLVGVWLFAHAGGLYGAVVRIDGENVELKAQQWSLWKRKKLRFARLAWSDLHSVRLCTIDNFLMPGGVDENYLLATTQGEFVLQTTLWGVQARQIAELIAQRIHQPIQYPADDPQAESLLSPADRLGIKLMRGFGWVCTILACVFMALLLLAQFAAKPGERLALGKATFFFGFVLYVARSLRQFKVRMAKPSSQSR